MPGRDEYKVCVKKFPSGTSETELKEFFSSVGEVIDIFVKEGRDGWFAFIGYNNEKDCAEALKLNGQEFQGATIEVEPKQIKKCFKCGRDGHISAKCPRGDDRLCFNCDRPGHVSRDCPRGRREDGGRDAGRDAGRDRRRDRSRSRSRHDSRRRHSRRSRSRSPKRTRRSPKH